MSRAAGATRARPHPLNATEKHMDRKDCCKASWRW